MLGDCAKCVLRFVADGTCLMPSLPQVEATAKAEEKAVSAYTVPVAISASVKNYVEAGATKDVLDKTSPQITSQKLAYELATSNLAKMRSNLHRYAVDCYLALEFGDVAEEIFSRQLEFG